MITPARDALKEALEKALTFRWLDREPEPLWDVYKPEGMALVLADAVLAVPAIRRALAIADEVDREAASFDEHYPNGEGLTTTGLAVRYLAQRLNAIGFPQCDYSATCPSPSFHGLGCELAFNRARADQSTPAPKEEQ